MLKIIKGILFISIIMILFSVLINLSDYANYKQFTTFLGFETLNFKLGTWYIITLIIGITLFIISLITFLIMKSKLKQGNKNDKKN